MTADPLPRCPHGNEAVIRDGYWVNDGEVISVHTGGQCNCSTSAPTPDRARRAWVALCSAD